ncbi:VOC family protein [Halostella sp. PRR32]|uniref:VOC family protein n=1 Tax=Halostella sp. PRR32 TaxID=3098147 RepID=UPI002B1D6E41|nr:VOC family protein [Halostella sp. PRR32]
MALSANHYGITVSDLDRAVEFYRDAVGLDEVDRFSVSGEAFATGVGVDGASGDFVHLDAGETRVELVEYGPTDENATAENVTQAGAKHLGLSVSDLDSFYDELPDHIDTVSEPQTTESGTRILFLRDPEGNMVEVLEA